MALPWSPFGSQRITLRCRHRPSGGTSCRASARSPVFLVASAASGARRWPSRSKTGSPSPLLMACSALYRQTKLGQSLVDALDHLVDEGKLPGQLALRIMDEFDAVVLDQLESKVTAKATVKGHLDIYRYCDNVWTFVLSDATFRIAPTMASTRRDEQEVGVERVKIVVVDQKLAPQQE